MLIRNGCWDTPWEPTCSISHRTRPTCNSHKSIAHRFTPLTLAPRCVRCDLIEHTKPQCRTVTKPGSDANPPRNIIFNHICHKMGKGVVGNHDKRNVGSEPSVTSARLCGLVARFGSLASSSLLCLSAAPITLRRTILTSRRRLNPKPQNLK